MTALDAFIKLMRASESVISRLSPKIASEGLTVSQFGILETLYHLGPLHQCELGRKLLKSSGNITMVVDNLEKCGYAQRRRESQDRRLITVHLTESGRCLIAKIFPGQAAAMVDEMSVLTEAEQEQLGMLCRKLGLGLE